MGTGDGITLIQQSRFSPVSHGVDNLRGEMSIHLEKPQQQLRVGTNVEFGSAPARARFGGQSRNPRVRPFGSGLKGDFSTFC